MGRRDEYSRQSYIPVPSKEIFDYAFGRVRTRKYVNSMSLLTRQIQAIDVMDYYGTRFQVGCCFRDSKQFTGLTDCQRRELDKLNFHFNVALNAVNLELRKRGTSLINGICKSSYVTTFIS